MQRQQFYMSNCLANTLPHTPLPSSLYRLCRAGHFDVTRALTCEIEQSSKPKHTRTLTTSFAANVSLWQLTYTHTDACTCKNWLSLLLSVCLSLSLSGQGGLSFKMASKWNCWKIKNRSRHFVFHATRRLIIKTDFYMQRQCQRNVCYRHTHTHKHMGVCSVQFSRVEFASFRFVSVWLGT